MSASDPRALGPVIGTGTYVIAEAGVNHNGSLDTARRLIDVAAAAGADAVKFQTFKVEAIVSTTAPLARYQRDNTGRDGAMADMLRSLVLADADFVALQAHCRQAGITFLSSAFDVESARFLATLGMPLFKVPSGEITNIELLEAIGGLGRPVVLSTGMATLGEVERALGWLRAAGAGEVALLHCVSDYPAAPADANLRAMDTLAAAFGVPVGWSDHTLGDAVTLAAVARGARIVEKHFTLDKGMPGPDHRASLEPGELGAMIERIRIVEVALGHGRKAPTEREADVSAVARRSIVAARDLEAGRPIARADLVFLRPGTGIPPHAIDWVVGRAPRVPIAAGALLERAQLT